MIEDKLKTMTIGGKKVSQILNELVTMAKPGTNLLKIERRTWTLMEKSGGYPSFARVPGYTFATCLNLNDGVVHNIPQDYNLREGDLLNIDVGFFYKGYHTDCAKSFIITADNEKKYLKLRKFLAAGQKTLAAAIKLAVTGNYVGHISGKIQKLIEGSGYWCVKNYTGHGIGKDLHEPPPIPCLLTTSIEKTPPLSYNMTMAIEVIYTLEKTDTKITEDGWSVRTANGSLAACFEKTVLVNKNQALILTPW